MNMRINGKELKEILDKAISNIESKTMDHLKRIYFSVEDGKLKLTTFNMNSNNKMQLDTYTENIFFANTNNYKPFSIDVEDAKIISKFKNEVVININEDGTITVKHGNKTITLKCCYTEDAKMDVDLVKINMENNVEFLEMNENEFLEILSNLEVFSSCNNVNRITTVYNINTAKHRITTLDGYRIGIKTLKEEHIVNDMEVNLTTKCLKALKKVSDKKDNTRKVNVAFDGKYIIINGKDYKYIIENCDGKYFDVEKFLTDNYTSTVVVEDPKQWLEVFKYDFELRKTCDKDNKKPIVFYYDNNELYCYFENQKYKTLDVLETKEKNIVDNFTIGFDPRLMKDGFNILNGETKIGFVDAKSPAIMENKEYTLVVLPINIRINGSIESLHNEIKTEIEKSMKVA